MGMKQYLKDRDKAMMLYPDASGLDELVEEYPEYFDYRFCKAWRFIGSRDPNFKIRTMEKMIESWKDAPQDLKDKVRKAKAERLRLMDNIDRRWIEAEIGRAESYKEEDEKDESGLLDE